MGLICSSTSVLPPLAGGTEASTIPHLQLTHIIAALLSASVPPFHPLIKDIKTFFDRILRIEGFSFGLSATAQRGHGVIHGVLFSSASNVI